MRSPEGWANASLRQAGVGQLKRSDNAEELAIALPNMRRRCNYTLHSSLQYTAAGTHFGQEIQALGTEGGQLTKYSDMAARTLHTYRGIMVAERHMTDLVLVPSIFSCIRVTVGYRASGMHFNLG